MFQADFSELTLMSDLTIVAWRPTARETTHKEGRRISFGLSRNLQALVGTLTLIAVRSECDAVRAGQTFSHQQRCIAFRRTVRSRGECRNHMARGCRSGWS